MGIELAGCAIDDEITEEGAAPKARMSLEETGEAAQAFRSLRPPLCRYGSIE
jgi:hypothetical protein